MQVCAAAYYGAALATEAKAKEAFVGCVPDEVDDLTHTLRVKSTIQSMDKHGLNGDPNGNFHEFPLLH